VRGFESCYIAETKIVLHFADSSFCSAFDFPNIEERLSLPKYWAILLIIFDFDTH
jgi:hypothetical protein